jgi:hypothetical protein
VTATACGGRILAAIVILALSDGQVLENGHRAQKVMLTPW